jgi:GNAT superfamily N-acetyltransferase
MDFNDLTHHQSCARIWNAACGDDLAITSDFVRYNMGSSPGISRKGWFTLEGDTYTGMILACAVRGEEIGWIDAMAVCPDFQGVGIGSSLLNLAETYLAELGCRKVHIGGGPRPFTAGLPVSLNQQKFFHHRGYQTYVNDSSVWDMARRLSDYQGVSQPIGNSYLCPCRDDLRVPLDDFLKDEFPGRWYDEYQEFSQAARRLSDYLLLLDSDQIIGFCQVTLEDSSRPIERYYLHRLPRPWGQLGTVGIAARHRGKGYGLRLVDLGLQHLKKLGVDGCVIDWTAILDFYARFGFSPYRQYWNEEKTFK